MEQAGYMPVADRCNGITKRNGETGIAQRKNMVGRMLQLPFGKITKIAL
jgi:hypothetical protein